MTDIRITDRAVNNLRIVDFFDPNAAFNYGTGKELSLVSRDGYELVFKGEDFDFDSKDRPTDGTITDVYLYDPNGNLVGRVDDVDYSLEKYYDLVAVDGKAAAFTKELMSGGDSITGGSRHDYLEGYGGNDTISGGAGDDLILGGSGKDSLSGGSGYDDIDGGSGADIISGGDGNDLIYGGSGNDRLSGDAGADSIAGDQGNDTLYGGTGDDKLEGGAGNDKLYGEADNDVLGGGDGNDALEGGAGRDQLFGDEGNDLLRGGDGDDTLRGGVGQDTLEGGAGRDVLYGSKGADQFLFVKSGDGADIVQDFTRGEDVLAFKASGFEGMTADFDLVVSGDPTAGSDKGTFLFDTGSHELFWDADGSGSGTAQLIAKLDDVTNLTKDDFLIT